MKETFINSNRRLNTFYVSRFEQLNEQFLTGHSMAAYLAFYEDKKSIIQSLTRSCSDSETADTTFDILVKGDLFLDSLFWKEGKKIDYIYEAAIQAATLQGKDKYLRQLLTSRALAEVTWGLTGRTKQFLSKVNKIQVVSSFVSDHEKGKYLCYLGIYHLAAADISTAVQCLKDAMSYLVSFNEPEHIILKLVISEILAVYYHSLNDFSSANDFYYKAQRQCTKVGDRQLLIIPSMTSETKESTHEEPSRILLNEPLKCEIAFLLCKATKTFADSNTKQYINSSLLEMLENVERQNQISLGLLTFHRVVTNLLWDLSTEDSVKLYAMRINYHQAAITQTKETSSKNEDFQCVTQMQNEALVKCFLDLGVIYLQRKSYLEALQAFQEGLQMTKELFGDEHELTADSYWLLGVTQYIMREYKATLQSFQRALAIRIKLHGEEDESAAYIYEEIGTTQHNMHDFSSALQSLQRALAIRITRFGDVHERTAESYRQVGVAQHSMHDYTSALQSHQRALAICTNLFGEGHECTANSYCQLGVTQYSMLDYISALQSFQRALAIRIQLFGEEHERIAASYRDLGIAQRDSNDLKSALQSHQRALGIRIKLFREDYECTADSYWEIRAIQANKHDYTSALPSASIGYPY